MQIKPTQAGYEAYTAAAQTAAQLAEAEARAEEATKAEKAAEAGEAARPNEDVADFKTAREQEKAHWQQMLEELQSGSTNSMEMQTEKPKDSSSQLTALLVSAAGQFEVRQVLAQASKEILGLQMTAAMGKGEDAKLARAIIRKLNKLIDRGHKKIEGLNGEDMLRIQQRRAEQAKQRERAAEIRDELRQRIKKRKDKEQRYLQEDAHDRLFGSNDGEAVPWANAQLDASTEAQIAAQAEAQAAMEVAAESGGSVDFAAAGGAAPAGDGAGAAAAAGGGGGEAAAEGGGVDISV